MNCYPFIEKLGHLGQVWPDAASAHAALGHPLEAAQRKLWARLVRQAYSPAALRAGLAIFGRDLTLQELAGLQTQSQPYLARIQESRSLAPLLAPFVKVGVSSPQDYAGLRTAGLARGLAPSSWKWLCRQSPCVVRKLFTFGWTPEAVFWTNVLAKARAHRPLAAAWLEAGRPYMLGQHFEQLDTRAPRAAAQALVLERFLRLVPEHPTADAMVVYEAIAVALQAGSTSPVGALSVQSNSTWKGLQERIRRKEDERLALAQALKAAQQGADTRWRAVFGSCEMQGVHIRELTSNEELREEGLVLDHCVGNGQYLAGCLTGQHVIASLELPVTRQRATLQLRSKPGTRGYIIGQLAGPGNSRVPQSFWRAARELQAQLSC